MWEANAYHAGIHGFQQRLTTHAGSGNDEWKNRAVAELYHNLSEDGAFVIQTNHFLNNQRARLLEYKPGATMVVDANLNSDALHIDWNSFFGTETGRIHGRNPWYLSKFYFFLPPDRKIADQRRVVRD